MGSLGNPKPWIPYTNIKDCSQGFCSLYCPQWCYVIFPPPPPFEFPASNSGPNLSPLVIAIIGILASAFILVSYYAIISKYCGNLDSGRRRRRENQDLNVVELEENRDPDSNHEPWYVATNGLDEALIKSITVFKYKKGDGLIEGSDCSVCLGEFQEEESLRLLPKCSHAFHVKCIDTWLRSHSNCPLCRCNIGFIHALPLQTPLNDEILSQSHRENEGGPAAMEQEVEDETEAEVGEEEISESDMVLKIEPMRTVSDLGNGDAIIEIREEEEDDEDEEERQKIRRSVSMDYYSLRSRVSISDLLRIDRENEADDGDIVAGSSNGAVGEKSKCSHGNSMVLHCVMRSPVAMKRSFSFSSRRFLFTTNTRRGRGRNTVMPFP